MVDCEATDFIYPMKADLYYPIISQNDYGQASKEWVFDRTVICSAIPLDKPGVKEYKPEMFLQNKGKILGRSKSDIRTSSNNSDNAITNVLITNIRNSLDVILYKETAGPRAGKGTVYEIETLDPFVGPFGDIEYYTMVWRRTDSQAAGD